MFKMKRQRRPLDLISDRQRRRRIAETVQEQFTSILSPMAPDEGTTGEILRSNDGEADAPEATMYSVIHVTASDEVAVVPSTGVENDTAVCPGCKSTSKVAAARRSKAACSKNLEQFPCGALSTTGNDFPDAIKQERAQSATTLSTSPHPPENVLVTILRELKSLKAEVKDQSRTLAKIEERLAAQARPAVADSVQPENLPVYPATNEDELASLNASLEDEAIFSAMVKILGQIGGTNVASTTRRIFKKLVADEVAVLYSWTGRKGKKRAEKLKVISLVFAAVRVTQVATDDTLSHIIGNWLRFANVRLVATQKRQPVDGASSEGH